MSTDPPKPLEGVIGMGADHAGFPLKEELRHALIEWGFRVEDIGDYDEASADYPDQAHEAARGIESGRFGVGILVCGSGIGMSIAANRHRGVRAAACSETFSARMARKHNDANVLCIGARVVGPGLARDIVRAFLDAGFEGGRHERRVKKIELAPS